MKKTKPSVFGALRRLGRKTGAETFVPKATASAAAETARQAGKLENQDPDLAKKRLFDFAQKKEGWTEIQAYVHKHPEAAKWRGGQWNETLLHWAAISSYAAAGDLIAAGAALDALDDQGTRPIDWTIERLFFAKDSQKELKIEAKGMKDLRDVLESCARVLASSGADLSYRLEATAGYGLVDLALRGGGAQATEGLLSAGQGARIGAEKGLFARWLLAWLAGRFDTPPERKGALEALSHWGGDWNEPFSNGKTALTNGVLAWLDGTLKNPVGLKQLREAGADPDHEGPDGTGLWEDVAAWARAQNGAISTLQAIMKARKALGLKETD